MWQKATQRSLLRKFTVSLSLGVLLRCIGVNITALCAVFNPLTPNDLYMSRTAPLTSKRSILYTYSRNVGTEYFKHAVYSPFIFSSKCSLFHNGNLFGSCIIHILYTVCAEIKKNNSGAKGLKKMAQMLNFGLQTRTPFKQKFVRCKQNFCWWN